MSCADNIPILESVLKRMHAWHIGMIWHVWLVESE